MSEASSITPPCDLPCAETCPSMPVAPIPLAMALTQFQEQADRGTVDTGGYQCPWTSWGNGPPLIFIHGLADSHQSFPWLCALLQSGFRCITYDLPFGGLDGARLRRYAHDDLVRDLFVLMDHLKVEQSYLFASSFGTTIAMAAMAQSGNRIPRAILQGPVVHQPLSRTERLFSKLMEWLPGTLQRLPLRDKLLEKLHRSPFPSEEAWDYYKGYTAKLPIRALGHHARILHRVDLRPTLPLIRQPVLLVRGDEDPIIRAEKMGPLLQSLTHGGYVEMENCGHIPSLSHPEEMATIVRRFLTPVPADCSAGESCPGSAEICEKP